MNIDLLSQVATTTCMAVTPNGPAEPLSLPKAPVSAARARGIESTSQAALTALSIARTHLRAWKRTYEMEEIGPWAS